MDIDLGRLEIRVVVVVPLAGEDQIDAVIHVGANDRRKLEIVVGSGQALLFVEHIDQTVLVDDWWLFALLLGQGDRHPQEVEVVKLPIRVFWAETPPSLLARLGRFGSPFAIAVLMYRFEPGRTVMVRRERHTLAVMGLEQRPGHSS